MDETDEGRPILREGFGIFLRRWHWMAIPAVLGTGVAAAVAFSMDPVYESSATILIESQQIPTSLVASPVTSFADERIARIRQQVLSRGTLIELIQRNQLYTDERANQQLTDVVDTMRSSIWVDLVSAEIGDTRGRSEATIAFNLGFAYNDPVIVQGVTEQLTAMFIDADIRRRTEQASGTAAFLSRRADELQTRVVAMEQQISQVRQRFAGALPDQVIGSSQSSAAMRGELARLDLELQGIMATNAALAAQLSQPELVESNELSRAEENLARLTATYSDTHPDVRSAREIVARLRQVAERQPRTDRSMLAAELQAGRSRAGALNSRRAQLEGEIARADSLVAASPQAAYELNNLQTDYDNLREQYTSIRDRQLEAQVAANLEAEEKGERFSLVEAPSMPNEPVRPNRPLIVLMGLIAGLGLGLVLIFLFELFRRPVHSAAAVAALTKAPTLGTLPKTTPGPYQSGRSGLSGVLGWKPRRAIS